MNVDNLGRQGIGCPADDRVDGFNGRFGFRPG
jgi:hypothetical protein